MKLNSFEQLAGTPAGDSQSTRAIQARTDPMEVSLTDKAASAFAWAISCVALFVSAACVLIALFQRRERPTDTQP